MAYIKVQIDFSEFTHWEVPMSVELEEKFYAEISTPSSNQEDWEELILNNSTTEELFGNIKFDICDWAGLDEDDESEEQEANELTWQVLYKTFNQPFTNHY